MKLTSTAGVYAFLASASCTLASVSSLINEDKPPSLRKKLDPQQEHYADSSGGNSIVENYEHLTNSARKLKGKKTKKATKSSKTKSPNQQQKSPRSSKAQEPGLSREGCDSTLVANYTKDTIVGGTLYSFDPLTSPNDGEKSWITMPNGEKYVDLALSAIEAGCSPKRRPHMVLPSPNGKHSITTFFGDQDFHVLSNDSHSVVTCVSAEFLKPSVFGGNVHTGVWLSDDEFLAVDFTGCYNGLCGGVLSKFGFSTDSKGIINGSTWLGSLGHQGVASARGTSNTGPIDVGNNPNGPYADLHFVSDNKGAGSIMNATDMTWVKHFHVDDFGTCATGGLWVYPHPTDEEIILVVYGNQGDSTAPGGSCVFKVNMRTLSIDDTFQLQDNADAHGISYCTRSVDNELAILAHMRQTGTINVLNVGDGSFYEYGYDMNDKIFNAMNITWYDEGSHPGRRRQLEKSTDPYETHKLMPDLTYLIDDFLYIAARGPKPLSAVKEPYFHHNAHPGMFAMKIDLATCTPAVDQSEAFAVTTIGRSPEQIGDVHGMYGVMSNGKQEIWVIDQAGTGSIQSFDVYSNCLAYGSVADPDPPQLIGDED